MNQDGTLNILDVIDVVSGILGTTFRGAVEWLKVNFPELEVEKRLKKLYIGQPDRREQWENK